MSISFVCLGCQKRLRAPEAAAGRRLKCPNCSTELSVPAPQPAVPQTELPEEDEYRLAAPPENPDPWDGTFTPVRARVSAAESSTEDDGLLEETERLPTRRSTIRKRRQKKLEATTMPGSDDVEAAGWREFAYCLLFLTVVPLAAFTFAGNDFESRLEKSLEAHPEIAERLQAGEITSIKDLLDGLPDGRIEGAHLGLNSSLHWAYAFLSSVAFLTVLLLMFNTTADGIAGIVGRAAFVGTLGIALLLAVQTIAGWSLNFGFRGRGIGLLILLVLKLIGFSYRAALDPENGFLMSFVGFMMGVGLCEELCKALPLLAHYRTSREPVDWRTACVWGLACGIGFGVAEGIMYAGDHYNGLASWPIYVVRFVSCVGLHAVWSASVAMLICAGQDMIQDDLEWFEWFRPLVQFIGVPMILHALYDTLLKRDMPVLALAVAVVSLFWMAWLIEHNRRTENATE